MWNLVPWPGIKSWPHALGLLSLIHWTTREVPSLIYWSRFWDHRGDIGAKFTQIILSKAYTDTFSPLKKLFPMSIRNLKVIPLPILSCDLGSRNSLFSLKFQLCKVPGVESWAHRCPCPVRVYGIVEGGRVIYIYTHIYVCIICIIYIYRCIIYSVINIKFNQGPQGKEGFSILTQLQYVY